jgi:hypothetical protein
MAVTAVKLQPAHVSLVTESNRLRFGQAHPRYIRRPDIKISQPGQPGQDKQTGQNGRSEDDIYAGMENLGHAACAQSIQPRKSGLLKQKFQRKDTWAKNIKHLAPLR